MGSLHPVIFFAGVYAVALLFSIFICSSLFYSCNSRSTTVTSISKKAEKSIKPVTPAASVAALHWGLPGWTEHPDFFYRGMAESLSSPHQRSPLVSQSCNPQKSFPAPGLNSLPNKSVNVTEHSWVRSISSDSVMGRYPRYSSRASVATMFSLSKVPFPLPRTWWNCCWW